MFYVLLRCKRLFMHMRVSKRKKNWKKVARSTKAAKKRFLFKTCYFHKSFLAHKRIIYFCRCILEDDILDLIATGDLIVTKLWKVSNKLQ